MSSDAQTIAACFAIDGPVQTAADFGSGHIHDSYVITCDHGQPTTRYLLQRINDAVFRNPPQIMENIARVTTHMAAVVRGSGVADIERRILTVVPTLQGDHLHRTPDGGYWRMYRFIEDTQTHDTAVTPQHANEAARAFGALQNVLNSLPPPSLHETIPDFHNTPLRYEQLERAVHEDRCHRLEEAKPDVQFALDHKDFAGVLQDLHSRGELPLRTVHNDAKISNVLFDPGTNQALCVVDLDTIMPGLALNDFGDMVRTMDTTAPEDEADLSKVELSVPLFEGLARGYLEATRSFLTPCERQHLVAAGQIITLEQGVRFLTDFLRGDRYYKTSRPSHNLDRSRNQFKLFGSLKDHESEMRRFIEAR